MKEFDREIRVAGLRRSGNHAIINWIIHQLHDNCLFVNKIAPYKLPYDRTKDKNTVYDNLLYSYEDVHLSYIFNKKFEKLRNKATYRARRRYNILILRNPFNLFASRTKSDKTGIGSVFFSAQDLWKAYANEYLSNTTHIIKDKVIINYDSWYKDQSYRKNIARQLALDFDDAGRDVVPEFGGGSSFDKLDYQDKASNMKVNERWKQLQGNVTFEDVLLDTTLLSLARKIFDFDPDLARYCDEMSGRASNLKSSYRNLKYRTLLPLIQGVKEFKL